MTKIAKGFRLVPVEPSEEQSLTGLSALIETISARQKAVDAQPLPDLSHLPSITIEIPEAEVPRRYMRIGALMRNGSETDAAYRAMVAAAPVSPLEEAVARVIEAARTEWHDADCNMSSMRLWHSGCNCLRKDIEEALHVIDAITQEKPHD